MTKVVQFALGASKSNVARYEMKLRKLRSTLKSLVFDLGTRFLELGETRVDRGKVYFPHSGNISQNPLYFGTRPWVNLYRAKLAHGACFVVQACDTNVTSRSARRRMCSKATSRGTCDENTG